MTREEQLLIDRFVDRNPFADLAGVQTLLSSSADALEYYCQQVRVRGDLEWHFSGARHGMEIAKQGSRFVEHSRREQHQKYVKISISIAALLILFLGLTFFLFRANAVPTLAIRFNSAAEFVVTNEEGEATSGTAKLSQGDTLALIEGAAELELDDGIRAVIEAPAKLTFAGAKRIKFAEGQGYFEITRPEGRGFTVELPDSVVTDLGTRFGIIAQSGKPAQIHVFQGRVEAIRTSKTTQRLPVLGPKTAVREDDSSDTGFSLIANEADRFATKLPAGAGTFHLGFDETGPDGSFVATGLGSDGKVIMESSGGGGLQAVPGKRGRGLRFDGSGTRLRITGWEGIHSDQARTVACWVRLPDLPNRADAVGMGLVSWGNNKISTTRTWEVIMNPKTIQDAGYLRTATGPGEANIGSTYLFDGKWHHIASVFEPKMGKEDAQCVTMYIDGKLEKTIIKKIPEVNTRRTDTLLIGCGQSPITPWPLNGVIDEISIFRTALNESEIVKMANSSPE